jgi:hypothetical protein
MRARIVAAAAFLALAAGVVDAETLGEILRSRGLEPPAGAVPGLDQTVQARQILDDQRGLLVVYAVGAPAGTRLHATRFERASRAWKTATLEWSTPRSGGAPTALAEDHCRGGLAVDRFAGGFLLTAHINPSAECTIVLDDDLAIRAVLGGWPVAKLADGRIVYQRNQVHFAVVHPVALGLFDPRRPGEVVLYPRKPYQAVRLAHITRVRAVYAEGWCNVHNHSCDPDVFDEHLRGEVVTDARGDALVFVMALDNTTGWSDTERWGRLEAFREVRRALSNWDAQAEPTVELYRSLAAGLARARSMKNEAHVRAALDGDPELRDLVAAVLATAPAAGQDPQRWLAALDARWADAAVWRRLARAVEVPDEFTEVVYVYTGLRRPDSMKYRELLRRDFEARFGAIPLRRALEPGILRQIVGAGLE